MTDSVTDSNREVKTKQNLSSDEKVPDSSNLNLNTQSQKPVKNKKRKKPKDATAPRHPLTGYVRYLNDRRESVRAGNPNLPFSEITKILASEWSNLPADKKKQYLDAAEQDRERYTKEYSAYKQTEAYKLFTQQQHEKKVKENKEEQPKPQIVNQQSQPPAKEVDSHVENNYVDSVSFDIPIFTEEFLDHNKNRDGELRQLKKSNTDYEQQNAILQKHIENMKGAIEKLENDVNQQKKHNTTLQQHLEEIKKSLANEFSNVKLPGGEEATFQNIEVYMTNLHSILLENNTQDAMFVQNVRDIVGRMEFNG